MSPDSPSTTNASVLSSSKTDILHIEDDQSFADLVATFLERERESFAVHTETDPRDALATLRDSTITFDCIVSDYDMPELNGLEVLQHVREENPDLPFILFTGKGSEEIASEAITAEVIHRFLSGIWVSTGAFWIDDFSPSGHSANCIHPLIWDVTGKDELK